jgi:hypothetical protein
MPGGAAARPGERVGAPGFRNASHAVFLSLAAASPAAPMARSTSANVQQKPKLKSIFDAAPPAQPPAPTAAVQSIGANRATSAARAAVAAPKAAASSIPPPPATRHQPLEAMTASPQPDVAELSTSSPGPAVAPPPRGKQLWTPFHVRLNRSLQASGLLPRGSSVLVMVSGGQVIGHAAPSRALSSGHVHLGAGSCTGLRLQSSYGHSSSPYA